MRFGGHLASQLQALKTCVRSKPGWGASTAAAAAAAATRQASTAMLSMKCMASTALSSTIDSSQVSKAVEARRQLVQRCPLHVFKLRGVIFDGRQERIKQLWPGQALQFLQEPGNPHDPQAVHVTTLDGGSIGYIDKDLTAGFELPVCFGTVTSRGVAGDSDNWGVSAACCPVLHGVTLDLLPLSWREQTDMLQVFGDSKWQQIQQTVLSNYGQRCAVTSVPASEVPLHVIPQWRFDHGRKEVQLARMVPVCEALLQLQEQLTVLDDSEKWSRLHSLGATRNLLEGIMNWTIQDCGRYLLYVHQRQQSVEKERWQLKLPDAPLTGL